MDLCYDLVKLRIGQINNECGRRRKREKKVGKERGRTKEGIKGRTVKEGGRTEEGQEEEREEGLIVCMC
jgi:hypothetical protein